MTLRTFYLRLLSGFAITESIYVILQLAIVLWLGKFSHPHMFGYFWLYASAAMLPSILVGLGFALHKLRSQNWIDYVFYPIVVSGAIGVVVTLIVFCNLVNILLH